MNICFKKLYKQKTQFFNYSIFWKFLYVKTYQTIPIIFFNICFVIFPNIKITFIFNIFYTYICIYIYMYVFKNSLAIHMNVMSRIHECDRGHRDSSWKVPWTRAREYFCAKRVALWRENGWSKCYREIWVTELRVRKKTRVKGQVPALMIQPPGRFFCKISLN